MNEPIGYAVRRTLTLTLLALVLLGIGTTASAHSFQVDGLTIAHPWARANPPGTSNAAAYFKVVSEGPEDRLIGASSPIARKSMLHRTVEEDGQTRMVHVESVTVGPGEPISFAPGGYHLMLMQLDRSLEKGQRFPLTLEFEQAGPVQVEVVVEAITSMGSQP